MTTSRHSNPFSTCWTRPHSARYVPVGDATPALLVQQLATLDWRGEIVGPHGVGKSTLLVQLQPLAEAAGRLWQRVHVQPEHKRQAWRALRTLPLSARSLLVIDGFEQLSWHQRWRVCRRCLKANAGLLVTTHQPAGLPWLARLQPDEELGLRIFGALTASHPTQVSASDYRNAFNACNGNLREVFFNLYDLHERYVRSARRANQPRTEPVVH